MTDVTKQWLCARSSPTEKRGCPSVLGGGPHHFLVAVGGGARVMAPTPTMARLVALRLEILHWLTTGAQAHLTHNVF